MRWMWIDRVVELDPGKKLVAIKNVSLSEEHLHEHFPEVRGGDGRVLRAAFPVMPACFILEGMAQSSGILVGHAEGFREKVVLAKIGKAEIHEDVPPGYTIRYTSEIRQMDRVGASTAGTVEVLDVSRNTARVIGSVDMMFSHLDHNMGGRAFPAHNFVFGETFKTLLRTSGVAIPGE